MILIYNKHINYATNVYVFLEYGQNPFSFLNSVLWWCHNCRRIKRLFLEKIERAMKSARRSINAANRKNVECANITRFTLRLMRVQYFLLETLLLNVAAFSLFKNEVFISHIYWIWIVVVVLVIRFRTDKTKCSNWIFRSCSRSLKNLSKKLKPVHDHKCFENSLCTCTIVAQEKVVAWNKLLQQLVCRRVEFGRLSKELRSSWNSPKSYPQFQESEWSKK